MTRPTFNVDLLSDEHLDIALSAALQHEDVAKMFDWNIEPYLGACMDEYKKRHAHPTSKKYFCNGSFFRMRRPGQP